MPRSVHAKLLMHWQRVDLIRLALASALSDRVQSDRLLVVDEWAFDAPKTKDALAVMQALDLSGRVVIVVGENDDTAGRSFRNIPGVQLLSQGELNAYDILCSDWLVFSKATLPGGES